MAEFCSLINFYGVDNLDEIANFYQNILRLEVDKDQGKCLIFKVPGGGRLGFCSHLKLIAEPKNPIITFVVEDKSEVDDWFLKLKNESYPVESQPTLSEEFGIYHFFLTDPAGYSLEIQAFLD